MSKEKQIEEMAHALCGQEHSCGECDSDYRCEFILECSVLHRAGYRKQSEGEWEYEQLDNFRKYKVTCPFCKSYYIGNYDAYDDPEYFNFCPECGAKMKGGAE